MSGGREGAADTAVEGDQFAVEQGEEAGLRSVARGNRWAARGDQRAGGGVRGLGGVVEEELVEAVEDVGDAVLLAGQQAQPGPGEPDDDGGLGALALDVADGEAPAAVTGREEVVEVAAGAALVARFVDEGAAHARDLRDGAGQQSALEYGADGGLPGVLAGGADGERHPAAEVLDQTGDLVGETGSVRAVGPADDQGAQGPASGDQAVGERGAVPAVRAERVAGPGVADGAGAPRVARAGRVLFEGGAQLVQVPLARVPHAGQPGAHGRPGVVGPGAPAQGLVLQPHPAPVGEPGHDQLAGEGGDQVLVELPGQEVGGLGEEGQRTASQPLAVPDAAPGGAVRAVPRVGPPRLPRPAGAFLTAAVHVHVVVVAPVRVRADSTPGGDRPAVRVRRRVLRPSEAVRVRGVRGPRAVLTAALAALAALAAVGHVARPVALAGPRVLAGRTDLTGPIVGVRLGRPGGVRARGRQPRPHRLDARAVRDAPCLRERGDQSQAAPVLRGVVRHLGVGVPRRAARVLVRGLDDERARLLHPQDHVDVGAGVHHGVGDQFADDDQGVRGEVLRQPFRAGQAERGPVGERGPRHRAGGARRQGAAEQAHARPRAFPGERLGGVRRLRAVAGGGLPLRRNGPHGRLPGQFVRVPRSRCRQSDRPAPPMSTELPKWAAMGENRARRTFEDGRKPNGNRPSSNISGTGSAAPGYASREPSYISSIRCLYSRSTTGRFSFRLGVISPCSMSRSRGSRRNFLMVCQR
ncbi:hypothetical protein RKD42_003081 [Streptomyces ambofaciens]